MDHPVHPDIPHQMHRFARNRRLYDHLFSMGLHVEAVLVGDNPDKIDSLIVSTAPRTGNMLPSDVGLPVQGPQISKKVVPPLSNRNNVVNFPPKLGVPVAIRRE